MNYNLIALGNKIAKEHTDIDFYVFNEDWVTTPNSICFPLLQQKNIWGFDGTLISTNLDTTKKLLAMPNTSKKFFYVWDMFEHLTLDSAKLALAIYRHSDLTLLARSIEYNTILERNFYTEVRTAKDFNYDDILKIIGYR